LSGIVDDSRRNPTILFGGSLMPDTSDLDTTASRSEAVKRDTDGVKSVDYEAKYRGLSKKYTKLEKDQEKLQELYDDAVSRAEEAEGKVRTGTKDIQKQLNDMTSEKDKFEKLATKWEREHSLLKTSTVVKDKYKDVFKVFEPEDLRAPDDFDKPEDYEAYLKRLSDKITPSKQDETKTDTTQQQTQQTDTEEQGLAAQRRNFLAGATPTVSLGSRDNNRARSMNEIQDDMEKLDYRDPKYQQQYITLEREMDAAMASRKTF